MTVLNGHYDGRHIILDDPVPPQISTPARVKVVFDGNGQSEHVLAQLARLAAADDDLPADYSEQHEHYVKGTQRR